MYYSLYYYCTINYSMIQHATATTVTVFVNRSKLLDLCEQGLHHQIFDMKCVFEVLGYDGQPATDTFAPKGEL